MQKPPQAQTLAFVPWDAPDKPRGAARKLIRSHVMRGKNTQKRGSKATQLATVAVDAAVKAPLDGGTYRRLGPARELPAKQQLGDERHHRHAQWDLVHTTFTVPSAATGSGPTIPSPRAVGSLLSSINFAVDLDPFMADILIKHFTVISEALYPLEYCVRFDPSRTIWFEYLQSDPVYVHSLVTSSSAFVDVISGRTTPSARTRWHRCRALQLLAGRLASTGDAALVATDSTICSVSCLAVADYIFGDDGATTAHARGIRDMLDVRGGLASLRPNRQVWVKVARFDLGFAIATGSAPHIDPSDIAWRPFFVDGPAADSTPPRQCLSAAASPPVGPHANRPLPAFLWRCGARLRCVFRDLQRVADAANFAYATGVKLDPVVFQEALISIQYRLLHLSPGYLRAGADPDGEGPRRRLPVMEGPERDPRDERAAIEEAVRVGMLAFTTTMSMRLGACGTRNQNLAGKIQRAALGLAKSFRSGIGSWVGAGEQGNEGDGGADTAPAAAQPLLLMWMVAFGWLGVLDAEVDTPWVGDVMRRVLGAGGPPVLARSWAAAREALKSVLWIDVIHDDAGQAFFARFCSSMMGWKGDISLPVIP